MPQSVHSDYADRVEKLAREFASTAIERDRQGGTAKHERDLLRASGLLTISVPREHGGDGATWNTVLHIVRRIAEVDSSLAHLFAFQHLQLATVRLFANPQQQAALLGGTARENWFWGNAMNAVNNQVVAQAADDGFRIDGVKGFCSGSRDSDRIMLSALREDGKGLIVAGIESNREGIDIRDDWDNMGQRQTDSGTVAFSNLFVTSDEVLGPPGPLSTPFSTLRPTLAQLILVNLYLGIARGALEAALDHTRTVARPWPWSGVQAAGDDPYLLQRYAEFWVDLKAATRLADDAATHFDKLWQKAEDITADERGAVAIDVAEAKILATRVGLDITNGIFEQMGARATNAKLGFDRYWRNLRTHTLHDPVDYKKRDLGRWLVTGEVPAPSFYS
ncbi:acyl-CoA dehydrogenase family protein [Uliginosibacterium sp. H3]|uniref:Acyl-CoA dehydrogenase family protein n=1 Tax=Uliginosibacterium silvisoli TaxID=3114758 RepID=A0ABU6K7D8_9RHOO|nr:acyl-CoA dehydrogenase family protein [Uliginosibacterium sp. H3]